LNPDRSPSISLRICSTRSKGISVPRTTRCEDEKPRVRESWRDLGGDEVAAAALRGDDDGLLGPLGGHGAAEAEAGGRDRAAAAAAPVLRRCWGAE